MIDKLVFISDNVKDSSFFINNSLPDVTYVKLNYKESIDEVKQKLSLLDLNNITNIGLIFDNTSDKAPFITYTEDEIQEEIKLQLKYEEKILENSTIDNSIIIEDEFQFVSLFFSSNQFFSNDLYNLFIEIKNISKLNTIDIISCNIKNNEQFLNLEKVGLTVRYSTDITGKGGDWILESHNVNVTSIYFTNIIKDYLYRLGAVEPNTQDTNGNYIIDSADKLYWLMTRINNTGTSVPDLSSSFIITENIDMGNVTDGSILYPTRSIGNKTNTSLPTTCRFTGKLFGNNKEVIIRDIDNFYFSGFIGNFGSITSFPTFTPIPATIDNLTIKYTTDISFIVPPRLNPNIYEVSSVTLFSGLLIGIARAGTINNCKVIFEDTGIKRINISNIPTIGTFGPGGSCELGLLIGRTQGVTNTTNCIVEHNNDIYCFATPRVNCSIGGFCGRYLSTDGNEAGTLSNNRLNVQGTFEIKISNNNITISPENNNIGGFIGLIDTINSNNAPFNPRTNVNNNILNATSLIINCISELGRENVNISYAAGGFLGLGFFNFDINNCSLTTQVDTEIIIEDKSGTGTATATHNFIAGGFVGRLHSNQNSPLNITNSTCTNKRLFVSSQVIGSNSNINYRNTLGGFAGLVESNIQLDNNTLVSSDIISITSVAPVGSGVSNFGFGIGFVDQQVTINNLNSTLNKVYLVSSMINSQIFFGCLVGTLENSTITNSSININELTSDGVITIDGITKIFNILTSEEISYGGLFGVITESSISDTNIANITNLSLTAKSSSTVRIGGITGYILNGGSLINSNVNIGTNCNLISLQNNTSAFIGGLIGVCESTGLIQNNSISYGDKLTFKANELAETLFVNSLVGNGTLNGANNNVLFVSYPLIFNSISNGIGINFEGIDYLIQPQTITITTNPFFLIDLSDITVFVYLRPPIPANMGVPPCCVANICNVNPQTGNYSNQNLVQSASGAQLVSAVSQFYQTAATGQLRPNAPPIFKTYGQMMEWKQRQNRR